MKPTEQTCDSQRIDDYLDERLSDGLTTEFERHLCDCERCRNELQKRSAEPDVWRDAVALLRPDFVSHDSAACDSAARHIGGSVRSHWNDETNSSENANDEHRNAQRQQYVLSVLDSLGPTDDPDMLGRVGDYEISGVVGVGGMGAVLKGFDKSLRRVVAIKVMAPHLAHSGSARTRFQREARAAAAITHDNVIDIYAVAEAAGLPYLVMPYARGPSLQKRIDEGGPLGVVEVVRIGRQIAAGLSAAHEQGLVHRDIKPANILLSDGIERLWITDFGVARAMDDASMTQTGVIAGTPQYMSPEQARGESVDHRSDLFSLGSVLYTACTGRPPFRSEAAYGILRRITDSEPRPIREINSDIPEWLCLIIARLLAKHPADRFENAAELVDLLDGCLAHLQQPLQVELPQSLRGKPTIHETTSSVTEKVNRDAPEPQSAQQTRQLQPAPQPQRLFTKRVLIMMGSIILAGLCGILAMQWTNPTDISGNWTGDKWQHIALTSVDEASDWYSGTFVDADGRRGAVRLEWSRLQQRYNGRWKVGEAESGAITLRAGENGTLRGALSVDPESELKPNVPRLSEFAWRPASKEAQQEFESPVRKSPDKAQAFGQPVAGGIVKIGSPANGVLLRVADKLKLNERVEQGDFIAEIERSDSAATTEFRQQMAALQRQYEAARSKIEGTAKEFDAAREICLAIEAQIRTLEAAKQQVTDQPLAALEAQSNLDNAVISLKKAEADVVKVDMQRRVAEDERTDLEAQMGDLENRFGEQSRLRIAAPVSGKITLVATFSINDTLKEGEVLCEITPDPALPLESPENANGPVAPRVLGPASDPAPSQRLASEPALGGSIPSLSAFGPASALAKRMREAREKIAKNESNLEASMSKLTEIEVELNSVREKLPLNEGTPLQERMSRESDLIEFAKQRTEQQIESLKTAIKSAQAELTEAESEQNIIREILRSQISTAERHLQLQNEARQQVTDLVNSGNATESELRQADHAVTVAESELRQLMLFLKFYDDMGSNSGE